MAQPRTLAPLAAYHAAVAGGFRADPAQERAAERLDACQQALHAGGAAPPTHDVLLARLAEHKARAAAVAV